MKPSIVAAELRSIASAVENSKNPSLSEVVKDLNRVLVAIGPGQMDVVNITDDIMRGIEAMTSSGEWLSEDGQWSYTIENGQIIARSPGQEMVFSLHRIR